MIITTLTCMCVDIFDKTIMPGGESLNFAATISRLTDAKVYIIGAVGNDSYGKTVLDSIKDFNIDKTHIRTENGDTASNRTYLTPDGDRYYKDDSWNGGVFSSFALSASDRKLLHSSDMVHTTFSGPNFNDVIDCCREKRFPLSVDFDICRDFDTIEKYLDCISLLFISGDEPTLEKAKRLSAKYPNTVFIVTLGKNGSTAFSKGTAYHCAAAEVSEVTDTTGCGDSYQAGFIASYLADGNIETAMSKGSQTAAQTLSFIGGFRYLNTAEKLLLFRRHYFLCLFRPIRTFRRTAFR